jgi:hypothetical protein
MFTVKVDSVEYKVEFKHFNPANGRVAFPGTDCIIYTEDEESLFVKGETNLHPLDKHSYNKNTGRKLALARALKLSFSGELNKPIRKLFWMEYYKARGNKW